VKIAESIEQVMDMGKIECSTMNSITMMRDESGDDSEDGNHSYVVKSNLPVASTTQVSLPRLTSFCHPS
jgi:hypothetical protein